MLLILGPETYNKNLVQLRVPNWVKINLPPPLHVMLRWQTHNEHRCGTTALVLRFVVSFPKVLCFWRTGLEYAACVISNPPVGLRSSHNLDFLVKLPASARVNTLLIVYSSAMRNNHLKVLRHLKHQSRSD